MSCPQTLRQALVLTGLALSSMSDGFIFGQMSGMINVLREDDSPIFLSEDDVSWIGAITGVLQFLDIKLAAKMFSIIGYHGVFFCHSVLAFALVVTGLALASLSEGYIFGQMSGMINMLRADDSPITLSENEVSWIDQ
ncbi:unnamed protein product [Danaus chrysippus]|uniref:(African queen) hypothetical protein n=1 Tax=Danaus chrysippus TaxID=151541 RepID=A0A8J2RDJ7_9NEOP|nr:unnamed protein product [Danaus chrysippus]